MSHLDFCEGDLVDATSPISPTASEVVPQSLVFKSLTRPPTPNLLADSTNPLNEGIEFLKHPKLHFSCFVVVQVESALYRVPRALIQHSETYKDQVPQEDSDDALYVDGISTGEMEAFLDVWEARLVIGDGHFSFEQWAGALAVANRLVVPQIRKYAIHRLQDALSRLDPFDCIDAALKHCVQEWLFHPFLRICERQEPLSPAEILRLGSERSSAVGRVREKLLSHRNHSEITWIRRQWPHLKQKSANGKSFYLREPNWTEMSETVAVTLSAEAKRLIELETVLTKPDFEVVFPSAWSSTDPIPKGVPHPKYWQADDKAFKVGDCLYQLPITYFDHSALLGDGHDGPSLDSCEPITLPQDITVSEWNLFLEIVTARPFDDPLLSLPFASWIIGLRLAKRFEVESARKYILQRIRSDFPAEDPIGLLEVVKMGGPADSSWVQYLYEKLSQRKSSLTAQEIRRIGEDATAEVLKLRDTFTRPGPWGLF
ncbi:hypothetical protein M407DRAFT_31950 [Tulasnella calospora MUT 4182]|uniref:BTB domain-containing protein n=1 Tax=Tulasnella calospora MUT 4182 TaxID=1051891 RepID=A0A0C3PU86_9AGAM|nr:hypothetical protein M407DRAFT_31950 [Tulasnella calospora MUT 4182]